ncbi:MAG: hypothetical protein K4571_17615 [Deltaproteobacteria bacterium]
MEDVALYAGNLLVKLFNYLGADLFAETIEWIGVASVGYAVIIIVIVLVLLIIFTQRKGRR